MQKFIVIGGGLAGLTAANALAAPGVEVTLMEQSSQLGGRARTQQEQGYLLNLGPHAFYRGGRAAQQFKEWGIPVTGGIPQTASSGYFVRDGQFHPIFTNLPGMLATRMFTFLEKLEVANLLRAFLAAKSQAGETMSAWLKRHVSSQRVREFAATTIRISTFAIDLDQLNAEIALQQIRSGLRENVLYLDGGWRTLVDGLQQRAISQGVQIRCGQPAPHIDALDATGIVLAIGPDQIEGVTGRTIPAGTPQRMASLDLGLRGLPNDAKTVAFTIDRPLYFSVHSASARLAPDGCRMVHVAKYLGAAQPDPNALRAELEDYATLVLPEWRRHAECVRFLPGLTVMPVMPTGAAKRPDVDVLGLERVVVAGDWVGQEGMLADAAVASALRAVNALKRSRAAAA